MGFTGRIGCGGPTIGVGGPTIGVGGPTIGVGGPTMDMGGPIIGPRHLTLASITALAASTRPSPVAVSGPAVAGNPPVEVLQLPAVTSRAVLRKMSLMAAGFRLGHACLISAATPASCGAAAEVPLNTPHPSLLVVSSPLGNMPPCNPPGDGVASISSPGW